MYCYKDDEADDVGSVQATPETVATYLVAECEMSREDAQALVARHPSIMAKARTFGSFAYYVANEMLKADQK